MPMVKVHNDNVHAHKEDFKGTKLEIPAKGFIEMEYEEAIQFQGQCTGIAPEGSDGNPDARFFKMIRVDHVAPELVFKDESLVNHMTGKQASSADELLGQLLVLARTKPDLVVKDPALEAKDRDRVTELEATVARLSALIEGEKRGPGRPRKEAGV